MRTFTAVLKNNYLRTLPRISGVIIMTVIALATTLLAVHLTEVQQIKGHIVFITEDTSIKDSSKYLDISIAAEKPPYSALVRKKYDAYVFVKEDGSYQIETLRNEEYKKMLLMLLRNPSAEINTGTERGVGVNIIGFMMMFLLMISFSNMFVLADDKEQGQLGRIFAAPASFLGYMTAHCIYCLSLLLPEYLLLVFLKITGHTIGFTLLQYAGLIAVLGFVGISFALLLNTMIHKPDNASMLGNAITVLTTVLSGSFYAFSKNNTLFDHIIKLLPQKELMEFAQQLQNGGGYRHSGLIIYVILFSFCLFFFSCIMLRRLCVQKL